MLTVKIINSCLVNNRSNNTRASSIIYSGYCCCRCFDCEKCFGADSKCWSKKISCVEAKDSFINNSQNHSDILRACGAV